jgi:hypothetical protein
MPMHERSLTEAQVQVSFDWRNTSGVVTPVKNQGQCGSCWSFGATGSMEGAYAIANDYNATAYADRFKGTTTGFYGFSEQFLVSCDSVMSDGCGGGFSQNAFVYSANAGGIPSEMTYPYTFEDGPTGSSPTGICDTTMSSPANFVSGPEAALDPGKPYTRVTPYSIADLESAVYTVPVTITVQAGPSSPGGPSPWQSYGGGIVTLADGCGQDLDHSVLAVGWNTDEETGMNYWIIKNSWTADWGNGGYIYVEKSDANACGVLCEATYANMKVKPSNVQPTFAPTASANSVSFTGYISTNTSNPTEIAVSGLTDIRQFQIEDVKVVVNDTSLSTSVSGTGTAIVFTNTPSFLFGPPRIDPEDQITYFAVALQVPNQSGSKDTYAAIGYALFEPSFPEHVYVTLFNAGRYLNMDLPLNTNNLLALTAPAGNLTSLAFPMASSAQDTGIGITGLTISLQQTWPTTAPTPSPAPTQPIPQGSLILSTVVEYVYTGATGCSDNSKIAVAEGKSYGLCLPAGGGI